MALNAFTFGLGPKDVFVLSEITADIKVDIDQPAVTVEVEVTID